MGEFDCVECNRSFPSKLSLKSHRPIHKREKRARAAKKSDSPLARARLRARARGNGPVRAAVPCLVTDRLGAAAGDQLVFEVATERSCQAAVLRGGFVVYLERAAAVPPPSNSVPEPEQAAPAATVSAPQTSPGDSFADVVRKKIEESSGGGRARP